MTPQSYEFFLNLKSFVANRIKVSKKEMTAAQILDAIALTDDKYGCTVRALRSTTTNSSVRELCDAIIAWIPEEPDKVDVCGMLSALYVMYMQNDLSKEKHRVFAEDLKRYVKQAS